MLQSSVHQTDITTPTPDDPGARRSGTPMLARSLLAFFQKKAWIGGFLRTMMYVCLVVAAESIAAIWSLYAAGRSGNSTVLFVCAVRGGIGLSVAMVALIPLNLAIGIKKIFSRMINAAGIACSIFALQRLLLTIIPAPLFSTNRLVAIFGYFIGTPDSHLHTSWAWLDFAFPDPPLIFAALAVLAASGFSSTRIRLKLIFAGLFGWLLIELIVRPLLLSFYGG